MKHLLSAGILAAGLLAGLSACGIGSYDPQIHINSVQPSFDLEIVDAPLTEPPPAEDSAAAPHSTVVTVLTTAVTDDADEHEEDVPSEPDEQPEEHEQTDAPAADAKAHTTKSTTKAAARTTTRTTAATTARTTAQTSAKPQTTVPTTYTTEALTETTTCSVAVTIDRDGVYTTKEDVALYLYTYGELPHNFITKAEAQELGWEGGSLEPYAPNCCIGGSYFGNYEGLLPEKNGREYHECDINTLGKASRGAERLVYSNDGLIYYTGDHYQTFELLYGEVES